MRRPENRNARKTSGRMQECRDERRAMLFEGPRCFGNVRHNLPARRRVP
jgi:hypothetical protein